MEETPRVLVVEDDPTISEVVVRYLEREGLVVEAVADGRDALDAAARVWPDLVVLDLMLPGIDGIEVCRRLKADPQTRYIPVVMVTVRAGDRDRGQGAAAGADAYLTKPFHLSELQDIIDKLLPAQTG